MQTLRRIIWIVLLLALTNAVCAETAPEEEWSKTYGGTDDDEISVGELMNEAEHFVDRIDGGKCPILSKEGR